MPETRAESTLRAALPWALLGAILLALYLPAERWLLDAWLTDPLYGHGFLAVPLAAFLVWRAKPTLAPGSALRFLGILPAAALYVAAAITHEAFLFALSLVSALAAVAVIAMGARAWRLSPAFFVLCVAIPFPGVAALGTALQGFSAAGTTLVLTLLGVAVQRDVTTITANGMSFDVAPLCSGLSGLLAILLVSGFVAAISPLRPLSRILLVVLAVPAALLANILRIVAIVEVGIHWGADAAEGFLHGAADIVLFSAAVAFVLGARWLLLSREAPA